LNATETATEGDLTGSDEITNDLVPKDLRQSLDKSEVSLTSSSECIVSRKSSITYIEIDTYDFAGAQNMNSFAGGTTLQEGDIFIFFGANASRIVTMKSGVGNILLSGGIDFATGDGANAITLRYIGGLLIEVSRSTQQIGTPAQYRDAGYPFPEEYGISTFSMPSSGTLTFAADGSDEKWKLSTNSVTLTGDVDITVVDPFNISGDFFYIELDGIVNLSEFNLTICGIPITSNQALTGGWCVYGYFDGATQQAFMGVSDPAKFQIEKAFIKPGDIDADTVADDIKTEVLIVPVSFEAGEMGDNSVKMPYVGTVVEIFAVAITDFATDDAKITPKNNAGTTMTDGIITIPAPSSINDTFGSIPTENNTFIRGDVIKFTTTKITGGGKALLSIEVVKTV
jgi:hypothetical protein